MEQHAVKVRKIFVLVVHGIGEQRRFGTLEEVALNLVKRSEERRVGKECRL